MPAADDIVITGLGVLSSIGIGAGPYWESLLAGRSGARRMPEYARPEIPVQIAAPIADFDPKQLVRPRKSLKVMSRDVQLGVAAALLAAEHAGIGERAADPDRTGVIFGSDLIQIDPEELAPAFKACVEAGQFEFSHWGEKALPEFFPLWMLKFLPNMPACHVAIAVDGRGPNNTITLGDVSGITALQEAVSVLKRGWTDMMLAGGAFSRVHPTYFIRSFNSQQSKRNDDPTAASRPFDADRDGLVNAEGAAVLILETRAHAEARRATILARVTGQGSGFASHPDSFESRFEAVRSVIRQALQSADLAPQDVAYVNAHGASTTLDDAIEAQAIRAELGDVPVTAFKSMIGHVGAAGGMIELAGSVLGLQAGMVPATINYEHPDPECPVNVVAKAPLSDRRGPVLKLSLAPSGQAVAVVVDAP